MVAKIVSGKSIRGILIYNEDKVATGEAKLIMASGFATDIDRLNFHQKLFRFEQLIQLNARVKTNAMHITLNFHSDDRLDMEKLQQITSEYMERIGFGEQPYIAYEHFDASHPHVHIATTTMQRSGKSININKIGFRLSGPARSALEEKFDLIRAKGRKMGNAHFLKPAVYGEKPTKRQLAGITSAVMREYAYVSFEQYKAALSQFNVHAERGETGSVMFEKNGLRYSMTDGMGNLVGVPLKASSFFNGATMESIERRSEKNRERRASAVVDLRSRIDGVLARFALVTRATLLRELAGEQVALVLRENSSGLIYGATFIDHKNRVVFNGSELGKGYSARAITQRLSHSDEPRRLLQREVGSKLLHRENFLQGDRDSSVERDNGVLDILLAKADFGVPSGTGRKRKRKKPRGQSPSQNL